MRISKFQRYADLWNMVAQSPRLNNERLAGYFELSGDLLRYSGSFFGNWDLRVGEVVAIAQADDLSGPWTEDLYYVFLYYRGKKLKMRKASVMGRADGYEWSFDFLSSHFVEMHPPCLLMPDPKSVVSEVLWPKSLAGMPLFDVKPVLPGLRRFGLIQNSVRISSDLVETISVRLG